MKDDANYIDSEIQNDDSLKHEHTPFSNHAIQHVKPNVKTRKCRREEANNAHFLYVVSKIKSEILITLTTKQLEGIREALAQKHPVDYRFSLPLWFIKMYIVVAIGRDRRSSTVLKEKHRRVFSYLCGVLGGIYALLCLMAPLMLILLYLLKAWLNIDYFEHFHLSWVLEDW
jgi:hypothetical protein